MSVRVLSKPPKLRLVCPGCGRTLGYSPEDLRVYEVHNLFGFVVDSLRVLDCPKCRQVIRPKKPSWVPRG